MAAHAFRSSDNKVMVEFYKKNHLTPLKENIDCFLIKMSALVRLCMTSPGNDNAALMEGAPNFKLLCVIRSPSDAVSSIVGMSGRSAQHLRREKTWAGRIRMIVRCYADVFALRDRYPGRVFVLYQDEFNREKFEHLAEFLCLQADDKWLDFIDQHARVRKSSYTYSDDQIQDYVRVVREELADYPEDCEHFLRLSPSIAEQPTHPPS